MWSTVVVLVTCLSLPATNSPQSDSAIPGPQSGPRGRSHWLVAYACQ